MKLAGDLFMVAGSLLMLAGLVLVIWPVYGLKRRDGLLAWALSIAFAALGPALNPDLAAKPSQSSPVSTPAQASTSIEIKKPLDNIRITGLRWERSGFGSIMMATFVINNDNAFPIKDVQVTCIHAAKTGTVIDSNTRTIYESIAARGYQSVVSENMGFIHSAAERTACNVSNFSRAG